MAMCPNCTKDLRRVHEGKEQYWFCESCKGRAISWNLLRDRLEKDYKNQIWQKMHKDQGRLGRCCALCKLRMLSFASKDGPVPDYLDYCKACQFLWFDPREYDNFPLLPEEKKQELPAEALQQIAVFESEMIAKKVQNDPTLQQPESGLKGFLGLFLPMQEGTGPVTGVPWVTILVALGLFGVSLSSFYDLSQATQRLALYPSDISHNGGLNVFLSFFLHQSVGLWLAHLYFLIVFGYVIEDLLGPLRFLGLLAFAQLGTVYSHIFLTNNPSTPMLGAGGVITALFIFYVLQFPKAHFAQFLRLGPGMRWIRFPAAMILLFWMTIHITWTLRATTRTMEVSLWGHLGGLLVGIVAWSLWRATAKKQEKVIFD